MDVIRKSAILSLVPEYQLLCKMHEAAEIPPPCSILTHSSQEVLEATRQGYTAGQIYYIVTDPHDITPSLYHCRMVIADAAMLAEINKTAHRSPHAEKLPSVGLQLVPEQFSNGQQTGIPAGQLGALAPQIRACQSISVRGCFITGDLKQLHGKDLGHYFRTCYETAKRMAFTLPCAMPYLCMCSCLGALSNNQETHPETLADALRTAGIVAKQNNTAFYAHLLIQ